MRSDKSPFILEPFNTMASRYECPSCHHKHEFTRYVDRALNHIFPETVGRCNREKKCGYHYRPRHYFKDNPGSKQKYAKYWGGWNGVYNVHKVHREPLCIEKKKEPSYIPRDMMEDTLGDYSNNNFVLFLENLVGKEKALKMISKYHVGTTDRWKGSTVFWQVDQEGQIHHGKIMCYNFVSGHREKRFSTYECYKKLPDFNLGQCFFGEHLLTDKEKIVAIVESEKTAIIATEFMPEFIWLASGGAAGCINQRMHILEGRNVILYPDLGKESDWEVVASRMRGIGVANVSVSHVLEDNASDSDREHGLDISDYLIAHLKKQKPDGCPF